MKIVGHMYCIGSAATVSTDIDISAIYPCLVELSGHQFDRRKNIWPEAALQAIEVIGSGDRERCLEWVSFDRSKQI